MNDVERNIVDRLAALEARVSELERKEWRSHGTLREKFRPKITRFHHYPARELRVPVSYAQVVPPEPAPSIAIVTPSFNQGPFIEATVASVLAQNYPALRYHIQDGGSSDQTVDVLRTFGNRISWDSTPDNGHAHAINMGFARVNGDIMAYLNSDDLLMPGALAYVARGFADNPHVDVVYGHRICINKYGKEIGRWILPPHDRKTIWWADFIPQETMFWRRRVWDVLRGFDETFTYALDWDFILRAHAKGIRFKRLPHFLGCFRVHNNQKTTAIAEVGKEEMKRLRLEHLGFDPDDAQVSRAIAGFLRRHVLFHRLYKLGLMRY